MARTVTINVGNTQKTVTFGWATLARIDRRLDESVYSIGERLSKMDSAKSLRMDFMASFVAACLDISVDELDSVEGGDLWFGVFMRLVEAFLGAVAASLPAENGGAEGNVPGSQASGLGLASSSGSLSMTSTDSTQPTSESSAPHGSNASVDGTSDSAT